MASLLALSGFPLCSPPAERGEVHGGLEGEGNLGQLSVLEEEGFPRRDGFGLSKAAGAVFLGRGLYEIAERVGFKIRHRSTRCRYEPTYTLTRPWPTQAPERALRMLHVSSVHSAIAPTGTLITCPGHFPHVTRPVGLT
jgi:hypothetical protein